MSARVQIYSAEPRVRHFGLVVREMLSGLRRSPYIAYRLAMRDIKSTYAKSAFGFLWDLLDPLVLGAVFYFLMRSRVLMPGDIKIPYSVYVIYGLLLYQTFADAALTTTNLVRSQSGLLNQLKLPPEALLLSVFFRVGFMSLFRVAVMVFFSLVTGAFSWLGLPVFLACYGVVIVMGMCWGVLLAPFHAIYNDIGRALGVVLVLLRYASPTLFAFPKTGAWIWLYRLNPIGAVLDNLRLVATTGEHGHGALIAAHLAVFGAIGIVGWFIFHVSIPVLADRS